MPAHGRAQKMRLHKELASCKQKVANHLVRKQIVNEKGSPLGHDRVFREMAEFGRPSGYREKSLPPSPFYLLPEWRGACQRGSSVKLHSNSTTTEGGVEKCLVGFGQSFGKNWKRATAMAICVRAAFRLMPRESKEIG